MNEAEKERLIKKDIKSIENRVRSAFNQGYDMGLKESRSEIPNTCEDAISRQAVIERINKQRVGLNPKLEQELCDDVCEWFEQYVDIAADIVELRFSDGTVKRAKRGLYMRDIEKSIRKMLIDQIANEKKQEPKWIPVSERLPKDHENVLIYLSSNQTTIGLYNSHRLPFIDKPIGWGADAPHGWSSDEVVAWMPLPEPYKAESEG